jgi:DNA-3-methyladenine glycosylase
MAIRRGFSVLDEKSERQLCNGPSKLCQAFGITRSLNGVDVCGEALFFTTGTDPGTVIAARRVGIDYAGPGREWPWRFLVKGDPYVSKRP